MILDSTVRVVPPTAGGDYLVWASPNGYQASAFLPQAPAEPRVEVDEVTDRLGRPVKVVRLYDGTTLLDEQHWLVPQEPDA